VHSTRLLRWGGLAAGLLASALLVAGWRIPAAADTLGTDVTVSVTRTGEVSVTPAGRALSASGLRPAGRADARRGRVTLRNLSGSTLAIRLRALPSTGSVDDVVSLRLAVEGAVVAEGPLGTMRDWSRGAVKLESGGYGSLEVAAWIPETIEKGFAGRIEDVTLEMMVKPVGGR